MAKILFWRSTLSSAKERCTLNFEEEKFIEELLSVKTDNISIEIDQLPMTYAKSLLEDSKLKPNQRSQLALHVHGLTNSNADCDTVYSIVTSSPIAFGTAVGTLSRKKANVELQWNGRWYPVIALIQYQEDEDKLAKIVVVQVSIGIGTTTFDFSKRVDPGMFSDESGNLIELTVSEVFERLGFRTLRMPISKFNLRLSKAENLSARIGAQVWVKSNVLAINYLWYGNDLSVLPLGTNEMPRKAIVEPQLQSAEQQHGFYGSRNSYSESVSRLPLVRIFSMDTKTFVFSDIDDLFEYDYDQTALAKLYLPETMKAIVNQVFQTPTEDLFGDLIRGKHGGVVILASGKPGVGKTLTAEVYAEIAERPLYVLEFGELGTTVKEIEENLQCIFSRVVRWNAVLQFDECEIFLSQRKDDLERSAIVGIFLRMLDYYEGLLFLTTNRPEVLDHAVLSRVMLHLEYPDLSIEARSHIWDIMLKSAKLILNAGSVNDLSDVELNGRQIRNLVRLTRILHPDGNVSSTVIRELMKYTCK